MECPKCRSLDTRVYDSREVIEFVPHRIRRRECRCGFRFLTRELREDQITMAQRWMP